MHRHRQQCAAFMLIGSVSLHSGCASAPNIPPPRMVPLEQPIRMLTLEQAMSYERALQAKHVEVPSLLAALPDKLYTQPINKSEPCKLPTSKAQLERKNFRAFWDGDCKNGYAYGMGRDIAISDTHHVEEITIHNGNGDSFGQPSVVVDFVNNTAGYRVSQSDYSSAGLFEVVQSNGANFNVIYQVGEASAEKKAFAFFSPFSPVRNRVLEEQGVRWMSQETAAGYPFDNPSQLEAGLMVQDPTNNQPVLALERYTGGAVVQRVFDNGVQEAVRLPAEYLSHMHEKFDEIDRTINKALAAHGRAQQLEREYLHMACSGKHVIKGLDSATATQTCNWRDKFAEAYAQAQAKYDQHLATQRAKQEAQAQRNHQLQQERARQFNEMTAAHIAQQAQAQLEYQQIMRDLEETNRQLQQTTNRIIESNARFGSSMQPSTYDWQQPKRQYQAPKPDWTERTYLPSYGPATLTDKRWENGVLWCIYSNGRVQQAGGTMCPQ